MRHPPPQTHRQVGNLSHDTLPILCRLTGQRFGIIGGSASCRSYEEGCPRNPVSCEKPGFCDPSGRCFSERPGYSQTSEVVQTSEVWQRKDACMTFHLLDPPLPRSELDRLAYAREIVRAEATALQRV